MWWKINRIFCYIAQETEIRKIYFEKNKTENYSTNLDFYLIYQMIKKPELNIMLNPSALRQVY